MKLAIFYRLFFRKVSPQNCREPVSENPRNLTFFCDLSEALLFGAIQPIWLFEKSWSEVYIVYAIWHTFVMKAKQDKMKCLFKL